MSKGGNIIVQNLTRIEIENFQSIEYVSIPLNNTGVHWINGKPNVGKSAVLKAIQALFTNVSNHKYREMIRDGQDAFRVKGYFGEDNWVELIRGEGDSYTWVLDGQAGIQEKTQGKVPLEVRQYYGLYWTGDKIKRYLNFTLVGDQLFFVETTSGDNTLILEKALGTDRLTRVGKYSDTEKREVRSELRTIRNFQEESENKHEELTEKVSDWQERLEGLDRLEKTLDIEVNTYETVDGLLSGITQLANIARVVKEVEDNIAKVDVSGLQEEIKLYDKVNSLYNRRVRLQELGKVQEELEVDISTEELVELEKEIKDYQQVTEKTDKLNKAQTAYKQLQEELEETATRYQELLQEKEDFLAQFEVCPFCERPMGSEHGTC